MENINNTTYDNLSRHFDDKSINDSLFNNLVNKLMQTRIKQISDYAPRVHNLQKRANLELDLVIDALLNNPISVSVNIGTGTTTINTTWDKALMITCSKGINFIKFSTPTLIFSNAITNQIQRNLSALTGNYDSIDCLTGIFTVIGRDENNCPQVINFNGGPIFEEELRKRIDRRFKITVDRQFITIEVPFDYTKSELI